MLAVPRLRAVVLVPAAAPPAKLVQMAAHGARVVPVDGSCDVAFELAPAACERFGWYTRSTPLNPCTLEGKKTAALEIAALMAPEVPDVAAARRSVSLPEPVPPTLGAVAATVGGIARPPLR